MHANPRLSHLPIKPHDLYGQRGFAMAKPLCFFRALSLFDFESNGYYFLQGIAPYVIIFIWADIRSRDGLLHLQSQI